MDPQSKALPWGSMSDSSTPIPSAANAPARLMARVVLPEPPFWLQTAMTVMPDALPSCYDNANLQ